MDNIVGGWESEAGLLSAWGERGAHAEKIEARSYVKPTIEIRVGDKLIINANGERTVALVTSVYGDNLSTITTAFTCRIFMPDGTLGRGRPGKALNSGFIQCFMDDYEYEWFNVEYGEL